MGLCCVHELYTIHHGNPSTYPGAWTHGNLTCVE